MADGNAGDVGEIDIEALQQLIEAGDVFVVDVRLPFDYFGGRVPGALNMPGESIVQNADRLPKDGRLVFVCDDGASSRRAAAAAQSVGFVNVSILTGGYDAWLAADLPEETISEGMLTPSGSPPKA